MFAKNNLRLISALFALIFVVSCAPSSVPEPVVASPSTSTIPSDAQPEVSLPANHAKEVEGLITVKWAKKPYRPDLYEGANYPDPHRAAFGLSFKNNGTNSISGFKGTLHFLSIFDKEILALTDFEQDETVNAGKEAVWNGSIQTLGNDDAEALYAAEHSKVKISFSPDMIIYADGSRWTLAEGHSK